MDYKNKNVLVCGIARSGVASALLLKRLGAAVTICDLKEAEKLGEFIEPLENAGIPMILGKNPDDIVKDYDLIIVSPGIPCDLPFFNMASNANVPVWGEIELAYSVSQRPVIAITGTNGKTTTTALTGEIMKAFKPGSETVGNIGVPFTAAQSLVSDDPVSDSFTVVEISSFQLETVYTFAPFISAVLNITPDHLNRHKSMSNYIAIKETISAKQKANGFTILNYDDIVCREMSHKTKAKAMFFSRLAELDEGIFVRDGSIYAKWGQIDEPILRIDELLIIGNHNIENAMAAVGIAVCAGVPLNIIRDVLKSFKGFEHRFEFVRTINDVAYYNDSKATNTDSAIKAIEALSRPIVLIGGGKDKGTEFNDWVRLFDGRVKHLVVLGETADKIIETCKAYNFTNVEKVNSLKDAVDVCCAKASPGDCVLLSPACASLDMFDNFEQRGDIFKEYVNNVSSTAMKLPTNF